MLRLWDGQSGKCLAALEGHTELIYGALELADDRLLSWSDDRTLRLWDGQSGKCLAALEGHTELIYEALELADGRLLSWSADNTLRLWNGQHGGTIDGMTAQAAFVPEEKLGLVILTNRSGTSLPTALTYRIIDAYLKATERRD